MTTPNILWQPNPGPQTAFLAASATEVLYGGAAGGGKSEALLMAPLRWVHEKHFNAVLFRRTFRELEKSLIPRSKGYYPALGGQYHGGEYTWTFPSGARIAFSHLQLVDSVTDHQSAEYCYIGFDELTLFEESQYRYLFSRARTSKGLPIQIRAGTNPEPNWVCDRWAPWVDRSPEYDGPRAEDGEVLWFITNEDGVDEYVPAGTPRALSRSFIRADTSDTPQLDAAYIDKLNSLDPVTRARLRDGDWSARPAAGVYFQRHWVQLVDIVPTDAARVRYWDRAGTKKTKSNDPDWTVGVLMARAGGLFYVEDVIRIRDTPHEIEKLIAMTAELDRDAYGAVSLCVERDPGQAGKGQAEQTIRDFAGFDVATPAPAGDKVVRFRPFSVQAEAGNVRVKRAPWNIPYFLVLEQFPDGRHDDDADATSGALKELTTENSTGAKVGKRRLASAAGFGGY